MSELINAIPTLAYVDLRIKDHISVLSTDEVPLPLLEAFSVVLWAVSTQLESENRSISGLPINCVFSKKDSFTIRKSENEKAICVKVAFYPLQELLPVLGKNAIYLILAEELCHLIWDIADETEVNFKVLEVLRNINPDIQMADLYAQ